MVRDRRFPRHRAAVRTLVADGISTILGPEGQRCELNATALALWELCDGVTTSEEMVSAICLLFDVDQAVIAAEVQRALCEFESRHLLEWVNHPNGPAPATLGGSGLALEERE
jgi:hypothetical protein